MFIMYRYTGIRRKQKVYIFELWIGYVRTLSTYIVSIGEDQISIFIMLLKNENRRIQTIIV